MQTIATNALTFTYGGAKTPALQDVSFAVDAGQIFGFLGPSGAGKSTTQRVLTGLLRGFEGRVEVLGRSIQQRAPDFYDRIGVSFEFPNHYLKLTAAENLRYFAGLYQSTCIAAEQMLERVGLADSADVPVSQYSKGMKTRLGVARALQHRPSLLFMDEPTAGLDPSTSRLVRDLILAARDDGATVLLTTHDMNTVDAVCDQAAFMVDGQIAAIGCPNNMKLQHGKRQLRVEVGHDDDLSCHEFAMDGLADNPAFVELLRSGNVRTMHTQEATLEDVFVAVTGQQLAS